ncbi:MAG: T9SS type A sorting domain-containing protein [Chitinophagaceae bacterium]|nr:MAG: T9SS type A sorting domain-containing protein [Chitinophagaceae bacterium]
MKKIFTLLSLITITSAGFGQWSNTSNLFANDQHMPVCTENGEQVKPVVVSSIPDGGYFLVWEDRRAGFSQPAAIYAQKYSATGNRLWATNGIRISESSNNQQYSFSSNQDDRNRNYAASDHAGGLYIAYTDDSLANYEWKRICLQHISPAGTRAFGGPGKIVAQTEAGSTDNNRWPQLIADAEGGCYVAFVNSSLATNDQLRVINYRYQGGGLTSFGSAIMNNNIIGELVGNPCGTGYQATYTNPGSTVLDYNIWPDLQGNCSVGMSLNGNHGTQGNMIGYNKLWKAKQDYTAEIMLAGADGTGDVAYQQYHKGEAYPLYQVRIDARNADCAVGNQHIFWIDYRVASNGFAMIDKSDLPYFAVKGITVNTPGNINAELITASRRTILGGTGSAPVIFAAGYADEIYTAVPYQRASNSNIVIGYNTVRPPGMDSMASFRDTLLGTAESEYDYSLAGGGTHIYAAALMQENSTDNGKHVMLQHLDIGTGGPGYYYFNYLTGNKRGIMIGSELNTGFGGSSIDYDFPLVTCNSTGNALFSINEVGRYTRVSPVSGTSGLSWGAMGLPAGSSMSDGHYINVLNPRPALHPTNGTGLIAWNDQRKAAGDNDIYMLHLDQLNVNNYTPPVKKIIPFPPGTLLANPNFLAGSSGSYSYLEAVNTVNGLLSPLAAILDQQNLGAVSTGIYEHNGTVRVQGGIPYLDRNYTITPQNNPVGTPTTIRLYFTTAQFDALKTADPLIVNPGLLVVIKQSNAGGTVPASLVVNGSETELNPLKWEAVDGGYFIEVLVNGFSNFFIRRSSSTLPVKWIYIKATPMQDQQALVEWKVTDQVNVKNYITEHSTDGEHFVQYSTTAASESELYTSKAPLVQGMNYYRVRQNDIDGHFSYSKLVTIRDETADGPSVYPNPATTSINVKGYQLFNTWKITDIQGRVIRQGKVSANAITVASLNTGVYFLVLEGNPGKNSIRFVKN